jgi:hypothetical protein
MVPPTQEKKDRDKDKDKDKEGVTTQDAGTEGHAAPNALTFLAWTRRLLQKDMLERGRRMLVDRIEEAYIGEYELEQVPWGLGFRVWGLGSMVYGLGSRVWGLGSRVEYELKQVPLHPASCADGGRGAAAAHPPRGDLHHKTMRKFLSLTPSTKP